MDRAGNVSGASSVVPPMTTPGVDDRTSTGSEAAARARVEPNLRWIRGRVDSETVVDTRDARYVWEFSYYPQWYVPPEAIAGELRPTGGHEEHDLLGTATLYDLVLTTDAGETVISEAARRYHDSPTEAVRNLVRLRWDAMDAWFEEEVEVFVHPRSPYTRVDVLKSTRHVVVSIDGTVVAESATPSILYETGLPPRYYLAANDVRQDLLTATETSSACPYKGVARYWTVTVDGVEHPDVVWGYDSPLPESADVAGLLCFYNEKVDLTVDGEPLSRPVTKFS